MPLFGGKKPRLAVTLEPERVLPGQTVNVRLEVSGELDKVRAIEWGLRCVNIYAYEYTDGEGDRRLAAREQVIHEHGGPLAIDGRSASGDFAFSFQVPPAGPPSAENTVEWRAWARADRPGRDVNEIAVLDVAAPAQLFAAHAQAEPIPAEGCDVRLTGVSSRSVRPGDQLEGTLSITPHESVSAKEVRVELECLKHSTSSHGRTVETLAGAQVSVADGGELAAGTAHSFPFAVQVPGDALPSLETQLTRLEWALKGVVARRGRLDYIAWLPIQVFTA